MHQDHHEQLLPAHQPKVLVVDDDPVVIKAMHKLLSREGFDVIGCQSAEMALQKTHAGINAAVLDIHLPNRDGLWLSQQIRTALGPATPIIILSGDHSMDTIRALPDAGATYFFSKPVNIALTAAAVADRVPANARELQARWDSVINARVALQALALGALCVGLAAA